MFCLTVAGFFYIVRAVFLFFVTQQYRLILTLFLQVLQHLVQAVGCRVLFSTHYRIFSLFAHGYFVLCVCCFSTYCTPFAYVLACILFCVLACAYLLVGSCFCFVFCLVLYSFIVRPGALTHAEVQMRLIVFRHAY